MLMLLMDIPSSLMELAFCLSCFKVQKSFPPWHLSIGPPPNTQISSPLYPLEVVVAFLVYPINPSHSAPFATLEATISPYKKMQE